MKRILLVEDDKDVRFVLEHVLLTAGYVVDGTATAAQALFALGTHPYDLVLADGKLPDGTGFDVADIGTIQGAKALIITGHAMSFPERDLVRHPYLMKPVSPAEIVEAVQKLIGPAEAQNSN
jgi:CheY-like chemotaxis protein